LSHASLIIHKMKQAPICFYRLQLVRLNKMSAPL